ncbi:MAG: ornithine cyclodeaminase family protein [Alphaproteobacteria bacterium]|nr:ornithine cyclodeaminase family protein [Alphaproteobacteria bacterium]
MAMLMQTKTGILYLSRSIVESLGLTAADTMARIEHLCRERDQSRVLNAPKSLLRPIDEVLFMSTLAVSEDPPFMAVKSLGVNAANAQRGMDTIGSLITLFDRETAYPLAVMDGTWITEVRTAALSIVAAKHFARGDSKTIAFIGSGAQARSHLDAFLDLFPLRNVRVFGRGQTNRDALCHKATGLGLEATDCADPRDAIDGADIIVSSVPKASGLEPFLETDWVKSGAYVNLVDLARTWRPETLSEFDRIIIEDAKQEAEMADQMIPASLIGNDLLDLVTGRIQGRQNDAERIAFIFRGLAIGDLALAMLVYEHALKAEVDSYLER